MTARSNAKKATDHEEAWFTPPPPCAVLYQKFTLLYEGMCFFLHISSGVFDEHGLQPVNHAVYKTGAAMLGRRLFCAAAPFEQVGTGGAVKAFFSRTMVL